MSSQVWWFVARSSGIVAWALLSLGVCWGLWLSTRTASARHGTAGRSRSRARATPAWVLATHRHLGGLAVIFTAIHIVGLVADNYVHFGWAEIFVPMASAWEPGAVAFGIVGFYLLLAIEITSLAMKHLPRSVWRWIHRSSFVLYATATYHGIAAGTDAGNQLFRVGAWASIAVVVALTLRLLLVLRRAGRRESFPSAVSAPRSVPAIAGWAPLATFAGLPAPTSASVALPPPRPVVPLPSPVAPLPSTAPANPPFAVPPVPSPPPVRPGRPGRAPLVPSGVPATAPLLEVPAPAEFVDGVRADRGADGELVNVGGAGEVEPEHPTAAT